VTALSPAQVRELKGIWEEHVRFEDHRNFSAVPAHDQKKMKIQIKTAAKSFNGRDLSPKYGSRTGSRITPVGGLIKTFILN